MTDQTIVPRVLFIGPLPPPTSGMPVVNEQMIRMISEYAEVVCYNTQPSGPRRSVAYTIEKIALLVSALRPLLRSQSHELRTVYASVDDGWGILGNIWIVCIARLFRYRIFLHHHSFRYLTKPSWLVAILIRLAGRGTHHILLCKCMKQRFLASYPRAGVAIVVPNGVETTDCAEQSLAQQKHRQAISIGMLSNLSFAKGLAEFLEIIQTHQNVVGVLAGPATGQAESQLIDQAIATLGDRLQWLGPVHGQGKEEFFGSIDLFVFPTKYRSEAYPLVLVEALSRGIPIIAWERGCISDFSGLEAAFVVPNGQSFSEAADLVLSNLSSPGTLEKMKEIAKGEGEKLNAENWQKMKSLAESIASS